MTTRARRLVLRLASTLIVLTSLLTIAWYFVTARYGEAAWSASTWWPRHDVATAGGFLVEPYLQLGDAPAATDPEAMTVLWHAEDVDADWSVAYRTSADRPWSEAAPTARRVAIPGFPAHRVYRARLIGLVPGAPFDYRVARRQADSPPFAASGLARKPAGRPQRFVAFGDCAAGTMGQRAVAHRAAIERPDYVVVTGDIVYMRGKIAEYRDYFFPVYNAAASAAGIGAPLLRSVPFLAAPGNHDIAADPLDRSPGAMAYFHYWDQPLNGPFAEADAKKDIPPLIGPGPLRRAYLAAAGPAYPRMANFSFDYGDVHWTFLDGNAHVDWSSPALRRWVEADLQAARAAPWRFVAVHQPPFSSSTAHASEQRTRLLADAFEAGGVSIVFAGHVHNYQRTRPLKFSVARDPSGLPIRRPEGQVDGTFALDTAFDGITKTVPDGVIYVVTGAGGARLYNTEQEGSPKTWQPFTRVFRSNTHSLSVVDVDARSVTVRQVAPDGRELDRFRVTKAGTIGAMVQ